MEHPSKNLLLVQDLSCVGRCSLTVALPVLACMGVCVVPFPTMLLSAHTGFEKVYKRDLTDDLVSILHHFESLDLKVDAVFIGYLAGAGQLPLIQRALSHFMKGNTKLYVDPIMGDDGRLYSGITKEMVEGFRNLCRRADIIFPNRTEAAFLLEETDTAAPAEDILPKLLHLGAKAAVLTGVAGEKETIGAAALEDGGRVHSAFAPQYPGRFHGTGDLFSSVVIGGALNGWPLGKSVDLAVRFIDECLKRAPSAPQERLYGVPFEQALPFLASAMHGDRAQGDGMCP